MKVNSRNKARMKKHLKIRQKISGTSSVPRLSIYKSHQSFYAQLIDDTKGVTLVSASTINDKEYYFEHHNAEFQYEIASFIETIKNHDVENNIMDEKRSLAIMDILQMIID